MIIIEDTIDHYLNAEIEHCDTLYLTGIDYKELVRQHRDLATKKLDIIKSFEENYN